MSDVEPIVVWVVGGVDPSGGAGLQMDIQALLVLGIVPRTTVTVVTAQTPSRVLAAHPVPVAWVQEQLQTLDDGPSPRAVKLGLLGTAEIASAVTAFLSERNLPVVCDPVLRSSSGAVLFRGDYADAYERLLKVVTVATPNLAEARALTGLEEEEAVTAALLDLGPEWAIVTGGDEEGPDAVDFLIGPASENQSCLELRAPRLPQGMRGTGCAFAACLAGLLARGLDPPAAGAGAKRYVHTLIERSIALGERRQAAPPYESCE